MTKLMEGKRGLIMGVANNKSMAWGIAKLCAEQGAEIAFSYQGPVLEKRVKPLAESIGSTHLFECDVTQDGSVADLFTNLKKQWDTIDFVVHAISFSDKNELTGKFLNMTKENFLNTMLISCYSFVDITKEAAKMMPNGDAVGSSARSEKCRFRPGPLLTSSASCTQINSSMPLAK